MRWFRNLCTASAKLLCLVLVFIFSSITAQQNEKYAGNYTEPFRPQFHFTPQQKWMNDPNGLVYFNGKYHLFYQYYPNDIVWGPMHWGHAVSSDLINWKHLPIALYPDSLGNIFSGSAVIDKNNSAGFGKNAMIAIFTLHNDAIWKAGKKNTESQGIAYSLDEGLTWTKYKGNPVLNNSGEQDFRDPKVFWHDKSKMWIMTLAAGDRIKFFSSSNLKTWKHESDFKPAPDISLGVWECPDLFEIKTENKKETKWVLIINHSDKGPNGGSGTRYFVGEFDGKKFVNVQPSKWMDYGKDFYAAVTFSNVPGNKKILLGWMSNWQYAQNTPTKEWRSAMTLPRELKLYHNKNDYSLQQAPVLQLNKLITRSFYAKSVNLPLLKQDLPLQCSEVKFEPAGSKNDLVIEFLNKKGEVYKIVIKDSLFTVDRSKSGITNFSTSFSDKVQEIPLNGEIVKSVRMLLDKSSIEIFINNGRYVFTNQYFPTEDYNEIKISSGTIKSIKNFSISKIKSIWQ